MFSRPGVQRARFSLILEITPLQLRNQIADKVKTIIAIEPSIENLSYLKKNTMNLKNVRIVEKAVGNKKKVLLVSAEMAFQLQ